MATSAKRQISRLSKDSVAQIVLHHVDNIVNITLLSLAHLKESEGIIIE